MCTGTEGYCPLKGYHNEKAQFPRKQDIGILGGSCIGICSGAPYHSCLDEFPALQRLLLTLRHSL